MTSYTVDQLAAQSGVPTRTLRFYQSKGVLQRPEIRGRVAYYGPEHIERLKLIEQLQERGLSIRGIRDLVQRIESGDLDLNQWLGLEAQLQSPWVDDAPRQMSEAEVLQLIPAQDQLIPELIKSEVLIPNEQGYLVQSQRLVEIAGVLAQNDLPLELGTGAVEIIDKYTRRMAEELVKFYISQLGKNFAANAEPDEVIQGLSALRPIGAEVVGLYFGHNIEKVLKNLVKSGKLTKLQAQYQKYKAKS